MGTVFFPDDGILLKKIMMLFYVYKISILYRFSFCFRKKLVICMLTDVLCVCFGMIISKLIEKPMFAVTILKYMLKYKNLIITSLKKLLYAITVLNCRR